MSPSAPVPSGAGLRRSALVPEPSDALGWHLRRAELSVAARKAEALRPLDLTVPQQAAMSFLLGDAAKSVSRLARDGLVTSQTMTGIVSNLEAKGLVERRVSPDHARVHLVSLTAEGLDLTLRAEAEIAAIEDELASRLNAREQAQLRTLLGRLTDAVEAESD